MTKTFSLAQILTITTGRLCTTMNGVYSILNHMTQDNLYTHQLPRAMKECQPYLFQQFPFLRGIPTTRLDELISAMQEPEAAVSTWLAELREAGYPTTYDVEPIPPGAHLNISPVTELLDMMPPERIIRVDIPR